MEKQKKQQYKGSFFSKNVPPSAFLTEDCFAAPVDKEHSNMCENKKEMQP